MRILASLGLILFALIALAPPSIADTEKKKEEEKKGSLDTFEGEATKEEEATKTKTKDEDADDASDGNTSLILTILQVPVYLALGGGVQSWERIHPPTIVDESTPSLRSRGESLIPFLRLDMTYQEVESDVQAVDGRLEAGYGPLGGQVRWTHYTEDIPKSELDFIQIHGLYRMSISRYAEVDMGFGVGILSGNEEHSGFSFALPVTIQPIRQLGVAARPSWTSIEGQSIADYDLHLSAGLPYVTVETGYRWLVADGASLKGPFAGASVHF